MYYIYTIQIGKGQAHIQKKINNTYSGQGDFEFILKSRQLFDVIFLSFFCVMDIMRYSTVSINDVFPVCMLS